MRRMVIAPYVNQADYFVRQMGWNPRDHELRYANRVEHLYGYDLRDWEVWWLDRMWPCRTHEDVKRMEEMWNRARYVCRGDVRRWWT